MESACLGGYSETKDADAKTQKLCDLMKSPVEETTDKKYDEFGAVSYRSQVVAGTNYLIKVHVGDCSYIHVKVYEKLPIHGDAVELTGVQEHHTKEDPLIPF